MSWTDPMWDDYDRDLVDAYTDFTADLHICGRPMSESLRVDGQPDEKYEIGERICVACMALEQYRSLQEKGDQASRERGLNPAAWRLQTVYSKAEFEELTKR